MFAASFQILFFPNVTSYDLLLGFWGGFDATWMLSNVININ